MPSVPQYLVGELVAVGTPDGDTQPRALVHCSESSIKDVAYLPMMKRVALVPLDRIDGSDAPPVVRENERLRKALLLARTWGIAGRGYEAHLAFELGQWVDRGCDGPLPAVPEYLNAEVTNAPSPVPQSKSSP